MAVKLVETVQKWIGLSTDTKPSSGVSVGSTFFETNTGVKFLWNGDNWVEDLELIYALSQVLGG